MKIGHVSSFTHFKVIRYLYFLANSEAHREGPPRRSVKLEFPQTSRPPIPVGFKGNYFDIEFKRF